MRGPARRGDGPSGGAGSGQLPPAVTLIPGPSPKREKGARTAVAGSASWRGRGQQNRRTAINDTR